MPRKKKCQPPDEDGAVGAIEMDDVQKALSPFCPEGNVPKELAEAVQRAITSKVLDPQSNLLLLPERELVEQDTTLLSRLAYVTSLLRLQGYLRSPSDGTDVAHDKAKVALGYVKHIEGSKKFGLILNLGRSKGDDKMVEEVAKLRAELGQLAHDKAEVMAEAERRKLERDEAIEATFESLAE